MAVEGAVLDGIEDAGGGRPVGGGGGLDDELDLRAVVLAEMRQAAVRLKGPHGGAPAGRRLTGVWGRVAAEGCLR